MGDTNDYLSVKKQQIIDKLKTIEELEKDDSVFSITPVFTDYQKHILENKDIFDLITNEEMDKKIAGEKEARKVIFLCSCGRLVKNHQIASYNLLVISSAGAGKDYVVSKVLEVLPSESYVKKTRISPTVFTYWHNSKLEPDWTWNGKVFYTEDINEAVLNHDVFKVMTSSGSSATVVIKQKAIDIDIKGKPVVITTTATATPSPELTRRFEFCSLDEGIDQTKEIMKRHSYYAMEGIIPEYNQDLIETLRFLRRVSVKVPFAQEIDEHFPEKNIIMRTKYPRFLDFIKASCAFHQFQRQRDQDGYYIAEAQDYEIARRVIKKLSSNRWLIPLTLNQQKIMKFFEVSPTLESNAQNILNMMKNFMALKNFQRNLGMLVHYGLIELNRKQNEFGRDLEVYRLGEYFKEHNKAFDLPPFEKLNNKKKT